MTTLHSQHNCETGEFTVYSLHDQSIRADLTMLRLTGRKGIRVAHTINEFVRRVEDAAFRAGMSRMRIAVYDAMNREAE
jgi:hypothetical protein